MATISELLAIAVQHHQGGRLQEAEQIYRQILQVEPNQADALHLLGVIASQVGKHEFAVEYIRRAIRLQGNIAAFHNNLGGAYRALHRLSEATDCYRRAVELKPDYAEAYSNLGLALTDQGKLDDAVLCYRKALKLQPNLTEALYNLGNALKDQGKVEEAVACYRSLLKLRPGFAEPHYHLGVIFQSQGKLDEAIACYRRALKWKADHAEAHNNLGVALSNQEKLADAVACYHRALELKPEYAEAHYNLGVALKEQGRLDEAVASYRRALQLNPGFAKACGNLGFTLKEQGKLDEAVACYHKALELNPAAAEVHNNLGIALKDQGKLDEAVASYRRALHLRPNYADAAYNLGNALHEQKKIEEAVASYRRTLELKPDYAEAHNNLANALKDQGKLDEAVACYRRALELTPDCAEVHNNLGNALNDQGKIEEAVVCFRRALELNPDYAASLGALCHALEHLCLWEDLEVLSRRMIEVVDADAGSGTASAIAPFTFLALPKMTTAEQQLRCARQWADRQRKAKSGPGHCLAGHRPATSKINVAYLSADFHSHATAWLIAELIEKHDRNRFAIFAYSFGPDDRSPTRRRLVEAFDRFVDVKETSHAGAAERIAADGIDILVDLKGYTKDARTEILSFRPAPIQANYLGYPGTMGAEFMDYILVDDYLVPPDQQPFFTEKLVHLPGCYQVNDSQREIAARTPSREECKLPADGFVFCSFNNSYKITPEMFTVWMRLLQAVPGSVLWLLEGNPLVPANLYREAQTRGVAAERLVVAPRLPLPEHLARHRLADLFLDTFPVNAHTTASDALWAGLPVLTLAGQTFASRVAGSLLRTIGLPELIAASLADYETTALRLARKRVELADLQARLKANCTTCGLFDGGRFARNLEKAYSTMWKIYAAGEKPRDFAVGHD
jgi:predicted O-linked N-acetylglucosamine transferase (SPINDLY family)